LNDVNTNALFTITMTYTVKFFDPKVLDQS